MLPLHLACNGNSSQISAKTDQMWVGPHFPGNGSGCGGMTLSWSLTLVTRPTDTDLMNMTLNNLSAGQLRRAAGIAEQIEALKFELAQLVGVPTNTPDFQGRKKRKFSAAGIARIRAAQKARWAAAKGAGGLARKPKRRMSAAAKARLSAIAKTRWKKARAAGKKAL